MLSFWANPLLASNFAHAGTAANLGWPSLAELVAFFLTLQCIDPVSVLFSARLASYSQSTSTNQILRRTSYACLYSLPSTGSQRKKGRGTEGCVAARWETGLYQYKKHPPRLGCMGCAAATNRRRCIHENERMERRACGRKTPASANSSARLGPQLSRSPQTKQNWRRGRQLSQDCESACLQDTD